MLKLYLTTVHENILEYQYFPEGASVYGILSIKTATGEIQIIKAAENDNYRQYLRHAVSELRKFHESGAYCKESTVAWY